MATNTLHNALCITQNLFKNLRLHIAIVRSAWRQPNISKHTSTVSCDLVLKNFLKCAVYDIVNGLILIHLQNGDRVVTTDSGTSLHPMYNSVEHRVRTETVIHCRLRPRHPLHDGLVGLILRITTQ